MEMSKKLNALIMILPPVCLRPKLRPVGEERQLRLVHECRTCRGQACLPRLIYRARHASPLHSSLFQGTVRRQVGRIPARNRPLQQFRHAGARQLRRRGMLQ